MAIQRQRVEKIPITSSNFIPFHAALFACRAMEEKQREKNNNNKKQGSNGKTKIPKKTANKSIKPNKRNEKKKKKKREEEIVRLQASWSSSDAWISSRLSLSLHIQHIGTIE